MVVSLGQPGGSTVTLPDGPAPGPRLARASAQGLASEATVTLPDLAWRALAWQRFNTQNKGFHVFWGPASDRP